MLRAIKIRLYPNATQATQINKLLGCYRVVYNQCLNKKIKSYEENKISENQTTLGHFIHRQLHPPKGGCLSKGVIPFGMAR